MKRRRAKRVKRQPPSAVQKAVARYMKRARARAKESQRVWGKRFGWSRAFIAIMENEKASLGLRAITRIAKRLRMKPSALLKKAGV